MFHVGLKTKLQRSKYKNKIQTALISRRAMTINIDSRKESQCYIFEGIDS